MSANAGSAASAWIAGYEIIAKYNNTTKSFTGNKLTLSAGDGVGFTTANNQITISAEGRRYSGGRCIEIDNSNKINLSADLSAQTVYLKTQTTAFTGTIDIQTSGVNYTGHWAGALANTYKSAEWSDILTNNSARFPSDSYAYFSTANSGRYISGNGSITAIITANSIPSDAASNVVYMI